MKDIPYLKTDTFSCKMIVARKVDLIKEQLEVKHYLETLAYISIRGVDGIMTYKVLSEVKSCG